MMQYVKAPNDVCEEKYVLNGENWHFGQIIKENRLKITQTSSLGTSFKQVRTISIFPQNWAYPDNNHSP